VGKTTVSRTLIDYIASLRVPLGAFDTEHPHGTLQRFHPAITEIVDIAAVPDQMRMFDGIGSATSATVIDVRAGLLSPTLQFFDNIGFLDALRRARIKVLLFHVLGPSLASLGEIADITKHISEEEYFLVRNYINDTSYSEWGRDAYESHLQKIEQAKEICIPKLNEMAYEQVEIESSSFVDFILDKHARKENSRSFVLRGYVRHWLSAVWAEFDRVKLWEMLTEPRPDARSETLPIPEQKTVAPVPLFAR
jgi:hypothetical protein